MNVTLIILLFPLTSLLPPMTKLRVASLNTNKGRHQYKMALVSDMISQEKIDIIRHSDEYKIPSVPQSKARLDSVDLFQRVSLFLKCSQVLSVPHSCSVDY